LISSLVVDTDVVSFVFKRDTRGTLYKPHLAGKLMIVSFTTVAELYQWARLYDWGKAKRGKLGQYLQGFVVIHSSDDLCLKWADVRSEATKQGRPIDTADAWIAATALLHNVPLVTHNRKHYGAVAGLTIISQATP
jgi:predicted nucleic acid-binding protein